MLLHINCSLRCCSTLLHISCSPRCRSTLLHNSCSPRSCSLTPSPHSPVPPAAQLSPQEYEELRGQRNEYVDRPQMRLSSNLELMGRLGLLSSGGLYLMCIESLLFFLRGGVGIDQQHQ